MPITYRWSEWSDISRAVAAALRTNPEDEGPEDEGGGGPIVELPPGVTPLGYPLSLATATRGLTDINVSFLPVAGAGSYTLQRKKSAGNDNWVDVPNTATSGTSGVPVNGVVGGILPGLESGTRYMIRVRSNHPTHSAANSPFSPSITASTLAAPGSTKLTPPTANIVGSPTSNTARVGVTAVAGAQGYEVRVREAGSESFTVERVQSGLNELVTGLRENKAHLASARALASNAANNSEWSDEVAFRTLSTAGPVQVVRKATPSNLKKLSSTAHSITMGCDPVEGAAGYSWRYYEKGKERGARFATSTGPSVTITGLKGGTTYPVQVKANGRTAAESSLLSAKVEATTEAASKPTPLPAMELSLSVSEPNLGLRFRFPGHPSVVAGTRIDVEWFVMQGSRLIKRGSFFNTNGPTNPGQAFTLQNRVTVTDVRPPKYAYGTTYRVDWSYTVRGVGAGPSGSKNWSYSATPGSSSLFDGEIIGGRYNPRVGHRVRTGYESGVIGSRSRSSGTADISALYNDAPTGARGANLLVLKVSGAPNWSVLTVGGFSYQRTAAAGGGSASGGTWSYQGGIPSERRAARVTIR